MPPSRRETLVDGIPLPIVELGPWALFLLTVFFIMRAVSKGDWVPRKTYEDTIHDRDMWRAAHMTSEAARQEERDQKRELLEHARVSAAVLRSLPSVAAQTEES